MAVKIEVQKLEEVPEEMREFVTEQDGVFSYDSERAFKALKAEREVSRTARSELSAFKNLNVSADQIAAYLKLGKPEEISERLSKKVEPQAVPTPDVTKSEEYLLLRKEVDALKEMKAKYEAAEAENLRNKRDGFVRDLVKKLPDEVDKDMALAYAEDIMGMFELNDSRDGLKPVGDKLPEDFLLGKVKALHFIKPSTPGKADVGNATISQKNSAYEQARAKGDIQGMIAHAKVIE